MPTEDIRKLDSATLLSALKQADCFYPIPETWLASFDTSLFRFTYNRDDSDYLFAREKIANYPGRDLSAKRNLLKQFLSAYSAEVVPFESRFKEEAFFILEAWQKGFKGSSSDYLACKDAIELFDDLSLLGYLVRVSGKPAALILGEKFSPKLFVIHFAKGLTEYKGIYPFLFKELASHLSSEDVCCLNWEQDLGEEGLRQSKLSYQPDKIAHKYQVLLENVDKHAL